MNDIKEKALIVLEYLATQPGNPDWNTVYKFVHAALHQDDQTDAGWLAELEAAYLKIAKGEE
jgi:hypothetical protein